MLSVAVVPALWSGLSPARRSPRARASWTSHGDVSGSKIRGVCLLKTMGLGPRLLMFYGYGPEVYVAGLKNRGCNDSSLRLRVP